KRSKGRASWPAGKISIRNRPPLISSTTCANRRAVVCDRADAGQAVGMRHWTFGCAMTFGAPAAASTAIVPPALVRKVRRAALLRGLMGITALLGVAGGAAVGRPPPQRAA